MNTSDYVHSKTTHYSHPLPVLDESFARYYGFGRVYHTWAHVKHVFACAERLVIDMKDLGVEFDDPELEALTMAIQSHDLFSGPQHEAASALAIIRDEIAADGILSPTVTLAAWLVVEGTTHRSATTVPTDELFKLVGTSKPSWSRNLADLINIIHDADLMILAENERKYSAYTTGVAAEALASGMSLNDFIFHRKAFMNHMLVLAGGGSLFRTVPAKQLHQVAMANIRSEISRLDTLTA